MLSSAAHTWPHVCAAADFVAAQSELCYGAGYQGCISLAAFYCGKAWV
jgi:hypothetical protein